MRKVVAVLNLRNCLGVESLASISAAAKRWGAEYVEITQPVVPQKHHFWQKAVLHQAIPDESHVLQLDADVLVRHDAPSPFPLCPPDRIGLVRVNPHHCQWAGGRHKAIAFWAKTLDLPEIDVFTEYPNLGFLMYSTPLHRPLLQDVFAFGERVEYAKHAMPEQTILALLVHHRHVPMRWMPTIFNTCGLHRHEISLRGGMSTFIYHGCGDSGWVLRKMNWRESAGFGRVDALLRRIKDHDAELRGAEIGVYRGGMASRLMASLPNLHLTLVDPWNAVGPKTAYVRSGDRLALRRQQDCDRDCEQTWRETEFAADRRLFIFQPSETAAPKVPDDSLDFVFIDAIHDYAHVRQDIALWLPKLRRGGLRLIGGHDYGAVWKIHKGVKRAVDEWVRDVGLRLETDTDSTWWVRVP